MLSPRALPVFSNSAAARLQSTSIVYLRSSARPYKQVNDASPCTLSIPTVTCKCVCASCARTDAASSGIGTQACRPCMPGTGKLTLAVWTASGRMAEALSANAVLLLRRELALPLELPEASELLAACCTKRHCTLTFFGALHNPHAISCRVQCSCAIESHAD